MALRKGLRYPALAVVALAACVREAPVTEPSLSTPLFNETGGTTGRLEVCKQGPNGTTATFQITASGGTLLVPGTFSLNALTGVGCLGSSDANPFNDVLAWVADPAADPSTPVTVTVTEVGATLGIHLDRITAFTDLGNQDLLAPIPGNSITVTVGANAGGIVIFKNSGTPFTQYCSYTPGGWGAPPNGGNIATTLYSRFSSLYPTGVSAGASGNYHVTFTTPGAVTTYMPGGGTPGKLTHNYTNPTVRTEAGEFQDQVFALRFNVNFSAAGYVKPGFNTATVQSGPLAGLTTTQVLALANAALGGNTSVLTPYGITIAELTTILGSLNGNYDNCTVNNGFLN